MKALVLLSGSIRSPEKSLATLKLLHESGFETDVFIHTWRAVDGIDNHTWARHLPALPPTMGLLDQYQPKRVLLDSWAQKSMEFQKQADRWVKDGCTTFRNLGVQSMFYGMREVADLSGVLDPFWGGHVLKKVGYDAVFRLRFDCQLLDSPLKFGQEPGWYVPGGARPEDRELQDQIAYYITDKTDLYRCPGEIASYFEVYSHLNELIAREVRCHGESLLYQQMKDDDVEWQRIPVSWLIH